MSVLLAAGIGCTAEEVISDILDVGMQICETDARCDEGLFCNGQERCIDGICQDGPKPCEEMFCDEDLNVCTVPCVVADCRDGNFCNGDEQCVFTEENPLGLCAPGPLPCSSDEVCDEGRDMCVECLKTFDCPSGKLCENDICVEGGSSPEPVVLQVRFRNDDTENTHILTASENFGPGNRLGPNGGSRTVALVAAEGDLLTFRAGRNQQIFGTVDCQFLANTGEDAVVTWTGAQLTCSGDLLNR